MDREKSLETVAEQNMWKSVMIKKVWKKLSKRKEQTLKNSKLDENGQETENRQVNRYQKESHGSPPVAPQLNNTQCCGWQYVM